jgi:small-conductance mechanosensitive channel
VWINLRATRRVQVESDLRYAIDELFATRGIVMSYPQRDVHLNLLRPVEVRMAQPATLAKVA